MTPQIIKYQISHPLKNQILDIKVPPFHPPPLINFTNAGPHITCIITAQEQQMMWYPFYGLFNINDYFEI